MDDRVSSPLSYLEPAAANAPPSYPDIAKDATDLRQLKKAVEDAASVSGGLWLSYLFVLFYLAVAAGAVTHVDLFFERPVKLPFLNIELPLLAFFFLAPILFLLTHVYTLVHFVLLTDKAKRFHAELRRQVTSGDGHPATESEANAVRNAIRRQLPSNIFVQFLAGPDDLRQSVFGALLKSIAWATLVIGPVLLLLLLQIQFLAYHSSSVIWTIRIVILLDLLSIWWLWRLILSGRSESDQSWLAPVAAPLGLILSVGVLVVSFAAATFPGEAQENFAISTSLHRLLFDTALGSFRAGKSYISSTLVLTGLNLYEGLNVDDPKKVAWRPFLFLARGRDLKGAEFNFAVLPKVDFSGAQLQGASFLKTQLQGASFAEAQAPETSFREAQLQGAIFTKTQLQAARFYRAQMQGATLTEVQLQGASLELAELQGASLADAQLQGASFDGAKLQGASFHMAQLQGASLEDAEMEGTSLALAQLQGASLARAQLLATDFRLAVLWRVTLDSVNASTVRLSEVQWDAVQRLPHRSYRDFIPWTDKTFQSLEREIETLPAGDNRSDALGRIASCDPAAEPLQAAADDRAHFEQSSSATDNAFETALGGSLRRLVCGGDPASVDVLRGLVENGVLESTGHEAPALASSVMGQDCPVSKVLTDADQASLAKIGAKQSSRSP